MNTFFDNLVQFLIDHSLVICASCKKVIFKKDVIMEQSNLGIFVPLCQKCRTEIFEPFRANVGKTCWYLDKPCPKCGKRVVTSGKDYWCENTTCSYCSY
jgi:hypothetical protein